MAVASAAMPSTAEIKRAEREIIGALDNAPLTRRHMIFLAAILASLFFDYGKPITLSFVIPGMIEMFDLTPQTASLLAVFGLSGTTIGAVFWGYMGDRIGRRKTLLWTVGIFSVASLCGLSVYYWNSLLACLVMGFGVGAEVPAVLASEYVPVKYRGRAVLFLGIIGWLGGYAITAGLAAIFKGMMPETMAWRWLWLVNVIPGFLILWLRTKVMPESARFLLHKGKIDEARMAAESIVGPIPRGPAAADHGEAAHAPAAAAMPQLYGRTVALSFFSLAAGLGTFGFVIWLPSLLKMMGFTSSGSST